MSRFNNFRSFPEYPKPDAHAFSEISTKDENEIGSIKSYFLGKTWKEVDSQSLVSDPQCIYFLTPRLAAYYLPSFCIAADTNPESPLKDTIVNYINMNLWDMQVFLERDQFVEIIYWLTSQLDVAD